MKDEVLEAMTPCEPYAAADLTDELGVGRRTVDKYLRLLAEDGEVRRKKHSKRRVSWWIPCEDGSDPDLDEEQTGEVSA